MTSLENLNSINNQFDAMVNDPNSLGGLSLNEEVILEQPFGRDYLIEVQQPEDDLPYLPLATHGTQAYPTGGDTD